MDYNGHVTATIGYARVSTADQDLALQLDALDKAGAAKVFTDVASGKLDARPGLAACLAYMRPGDILCVWRLDRLGRSMQHLIKTVTDLRERGIEFRSLTEGIDTTNPAGRLFFHIAASFAEFERELIAERTKAGLAAARARGRKGGRKPVLTPAKVKVAKDMYASKEYTLQQIADVVGCSRASVYNYLKTNDAVTTP